MRSILLLEDGTTFEGESIGAPGTTIGETVFATAPTAHWVEKLNAAGVPCGKVLDIGEVFDDPHVRRDVAQRVAYFMHDRLTELGMNVTKESFRLPRMVRSARTFPALVPWFRMDRIYQRGFTVNHAQVLRGPAWARLSDHSPLIADLTPL